MTIKINSGVFKGISLNTPSEFLTRPTSALLKRRLFDSIQDFSGLHFIDLCAGSGSIGYEALSNGADSLIFIEKNRKVLNCLKNNLKKIPVEYQDKVQIVQSDIITWLRSNFSDNDNIFLFFDPPYEKVDLYDSFFDLMQDKNVRFVVEFCRQKTMSQIDFIKKYGEPYKTFKQGTSFLMLYDYNKK